MLLSSKIAKIKYREMHTQESCMFLDIVLELSVQEYSRNPKNKVKNNDSLSTHTHI